jgi:hypothetical protein
MALPKAPGASGKSVKSQLIMILRSGLSLCANLLFFCANRAAVDIWGA